MSYSPVMAIVQNAVPPQIQGRVFGARQSLFTAMTPLGLAAGRALTPRAGRIVTPQIEEASG